MYFSECTKPNLKKPILQLSAYWGSNGIEVSYKNLSVGTYIYNNDPKGEGQHVTNDYVPDADLGGHINLKEGNWAHGKTYVSPFYFGVNFGDHIERIGINNPIFQSSTQNNIHRSIVPTPSYIDYSEFQYGGYLYTGFKNPYSLWQGY
jgi:hypothetical protein